MLGLYMYFEALLASVSVLCIYLKDFVLYIV